MIACNLRPGTQWVLEVIVRQLGSLVYQVEVCPGQLLTLHVDHLHVCHGTLSFVEPEPTSENDWSEPNFTNRPLGEETPSVESPVTEQCYLY